MMGRESLAGYSMVGGALLALVTMAFHPTTPNDGEIALAALFSGRLTLDIHGFGAVMLGQVSWFVGVGATLTSTSMSQTTAA